MSKSLIEETRDKISKIKNNEEYIRVLENIIKRNIVVKRNTALCADIVLGLYLTLFILLGNTIQLMKEYLEHKSLNLHHYTKSRV